MPPGGSSSSRSQRHQHNKTLLDTCSPADMLSMVQCTVQLLGLDVDPIFTVQFSNHTGFPLFKVPLRVGWRRGGNRSCPVDSWQGGCLKIAALLRPAVLYACPAGTRRLIELSCCSGVLCRGP